jgi:NADH:ubiquinone oxidoreductase subunit H
VESHTFLALWPTCHTHNFVTSFATLVAKDLLAILGIMLLMASLGMNRIGQVLINSCAIIVPITICIRFGVENANQYEILRKKRRLQ